MSSELTINPKTFLINIWLTKKKQLTMYIAHRRDGSKFNGCNSLQLYLGLIDLKPTVAYLPYTKRCKQFEK